MLRGCAQPVLLPPRSHAGETEPCQPCSRRAGRKICCRKSRGAIAGSARRRATRPRCTAFAEIATPIFEFTEVFARPIGEHTDIVSKEMYTFTDRGGEEVTLRPENTAGVVRAVLSNGLTQSTPLKFFYSGPMFRYERPQKGRFRQFHQIGVELLGVATAAGRHRGHRARTRASCGRSGSPIGSCWN